MEAIMVEFKLNDCEDVGEILASHDRSLCALPGYVVHVWLRQGDVLSLLTIFKDQVALAGYLNSRLPEALTAHPSWTTRTHVAHFEVLPVEGSAPPDEAARNQLAPTARDAGLPAGESALRVVDEPAGVMRPGYCVARRAWRVAGHPQPHMLP